MRIKKQVKMVDETLSIKYSVFQVGMEIFFSAVTDTEKSECFLTGIE